MTFFYKYITWVNMHNAYWILTVHHEQNSNQTDISRYLVSFPYFHLNVIRRFHFFWNSVTAEVRFDSRSGHAIWIYILIALKIIQTNLFLIQKKGIDLNLWNLKPAKDEQKNFTELVKISETWIRITRNWTIDDTR